MQKIGTSPAPSRTSGLRIRRVAIIPMLGLACGMLLVGDGGAVEQDRPVLSQPPPKPQNNEQQFRLRRDAARRLIVAERDQHRLLQIASDELRTGKTIAGLRHLQRLLDSKNDRFSLTADGSGISGIRHAAASLLDQLTPAQQRTYERLSATVSQRLLRQATATGDANGLIELLRRYARTPAGFEAAHRLAVAAFDRGDYDSAAGYWQSLLSLSAHRNRVTPEIQLRYAVALKHLGEKDRANRIIRALADRRFRIGGRTMTAQRFFEREFRAATSTRAEQRRVTGGNPRNNPQHNISPPFPRPGWTAKFRSKSEQLLREQRAWRSAQRSIGQTTRWVGEPLVVGNRILYRDLDGIQALHITTGQRQWLHKAKSDLLKLGTETNKTARNRRETLRYNYSEMIARNEQVVSLGADDRRVYFLDDFNLPSRAANYSPRFGRRRIEVQAPSWNRVVAIPIKGDDGKREVAWSVGGAAKEKTSDNPLAGCYFPAPPLPIVGRLYLVCELGETLSVACLNPADGRLLWRQPLATLSASRRINASPRLRTTPLVYAGGVLVCATPNGYLTALDPLTGSLRWATAFRDDDGDEGLGVAFEGLTGEHNGFALRPVISHGRLVFLPPNVGPLQCFDLKTGHRLWQQPRGETLCIGAVDAKTVVIVGRRRVSGLDIATGKQRWESPIATPTGRGLATQNHYLVPTADGRIVALHRQTGKPLGLSAPEFVDADSTEPWQPGNLAVAGKWVLSVEHDRIRAIPQAGPLFVDVERKLRTGSPSRSDKQTAAELALLLGKTERADRLLQDLVNTAAKTAKPDRKTARTQSLLRELLFQRLKNRDGNPAQQLARLERMSLDAASRVRFLMAKTDWQLASRNITGVLRTMDELAGLQFKGLFPAPDDVGRLLSVSAWSAETLRKIAALKSVDAASLQVQITARGRVATKSDRKAALERYLDLFGSHAASEPFRNELARRLIASHDDQRAELLLLRNRKSTDKRTAAIATERLVQLWNGHRLYEQAAALTRELATRFATTKLSDGRTTGREFALRAMRTQFAATATARLAGPQFPVRRVDIVSSTKLDIDSKRQQLFSNFRQLFAIPGDGPYWLVDAGDSVRSELTVVDRTTGVDIGRIAIPLRHSISLYAGYAQAGRFLSVGSSGTMHGVSLLQRKAGKPFWEQKPFGFNGRRDILHVGPATTNYAVFQAGEHLIAVDPGTGRLLWQRSDIPTASGLLIDQTTGLFGDNRALVMVTGREGRSLDFSVFDPVTGRRIRNARLSVHEGPSMVTCGRFVMHASVTGGKRLRIWDPLTGKQLIDRPGDDIVTVDQVDKRRSALLTRDGNLLLIDLATGHIRKLMQFDPAEIRGVTYLKTFEQNGVLFINPQRPVPFRDVHFSFYLGDALARGTHFRGELYAVDPRTGRRLWKRSFPQRTVLKLRQGRLPCLVLGARIRDRARGTRTGLHIEAIDTHTGESLGKRDDLFPDRLLNLHYDPKQNAVEIDGLRSTIRLKLRRRRIVGDAEGIGL